MKLTERHIIELIKRITGGEVVVTRDNGETCDRVDKEVWWGVVVDTGCDTGDRCGTE